MAKLHTGLRVPAPSTLLKQCLPQFQGSKVRGLKASYVTGLWQGNKLCQSLLNPCSFSRVRAVSVAYSDLGPITKQLVQAHYK